MVEDAGGSGGSGGGMKAAVEKILEDTGFRERRAAKVSIDEFLELLTAFNAAGIHFVA